MSKEVVTYSFYPVNVYLEGKLTFCTKSTFWGPPTFWGPTPVMS